MVFDSFSLENRRFSSSEALFPVGPKGVQVRAKEPEGEEG